MFHGTMHGDVYIYSFIHHSVLMSQGPILCDVYMHSFITLCSCLMDIYLQYFTTEHTTLLSRSTNGKLCLNLKETKIQAQIYFLRQFEIATGPYKARLTPKFKLNLSRFQCIWCTKSISSKKQT